MAGQPTASRVRVRNTHTATVCGIREGELGDVDASNAGIQGLLKARLLVPLEEAPPAAAAPTTASTGQEDLTKALADVAQAQGELDALRGTHAHLSEQVTDLQGQVEDLGRALARQNAAVDEAQVAVADRDAMLHELGTENDGLRSQLAALRAELAAASASTPDPVAPDAAPAAASTAPAASRGDRTKAPRG